MFKSINIFRKFCCIFEIYIKFWAFWKKYHLHGFNMPEVIDSEKRGYLNALKLVFQNILWKTLLKSARYHFYTNVLLMWIKWSCASCPLVRSKILRPLFNALRHHHTYSCQKWQKCQHQVQTQLSTKPSTLNANFVQLPKSTYNSVHFEKKISFIDYIFLKLLNPKNMVSRMS